MSEPSPPQRVVNRLGVSAPIAAALCLCIALGCNPAPDVLLVVLDTTRADALSLYGNPRPTSPRLDAFAETAVVFDNAFSVAPSTPPALAALMTGRLPHYDPSLRWNDRNAHGMLRFFPDGHGLGLAPSLLTLAERFQQAGYRTVAVVTNPYVKRVYGFEQGFDDYQEIFRSDAPVYGLATQVVDAALKVLEAESEKPLFLYLHFMDAHDPYLPPETHRAAIDFPTLPALDDEQLNGAWLHAPYSENDLPLADMAAHARGLYDASVHYMDEEFGRLLDGYAAHRSLDRALISILGDHGEEFLEHGSNRHRGTVYDELLHVPLLLKLPEVTPRRVAGVVRHFDAGATLLDFAGLESLPGTEARSLRPLLEEDEPVSNREVIGSFPVLSYGMPYRFFLRNARHKLVYDLRVPSRSELYDLEIDPGEHTNLYEKQPALAAQLLRRIDATMEPLEAEWRAVSKPRRQALIVSDFANMQTTPGSQLALEPDGSTELRAQEGATAGIELPFLAFVEPARIRVRLDVESPVPTVVRVRWLDPEDPEWRDWRSVVASNPSGRQSVELELEPPAGLVGPLRIEVEPAPLRLRQLEVLDLSVSDAAEAPPLAAPGAIDATTLEQLRALGYVEGDDASEARSNRW